MSEEALNKFGDAIKPFRNLWRSVRVAALAARRNERWVSIGLRVTLGEGNPRGVVHVIREIEEFLAFDIELPFSEMGNIVRSLVVDGHVPIILQPTAVIPEPIFLSKTPEGPVASVAPLHWDAPFRSERLQSKQYYKIDRTFIRTSATLDRMYEILPADVAQRINWRIGQETEFENLDDLGRTLIPGWTASSDSKNAEILALLPFDLASASPGRISIRAPAKAFANGLDLKLTFKPNGRAQRAKLPENTSPEQDGMTCAEYVFDWPDGAEIVKASLYFANQMVDSNEVGRWDDAATARLALNSYFDPGHKYLKEFLSGSEQNRGKSRQELFEIGVMRLFGLFGVPAVWYGGGGSLDQRPDGCAIVQDNQGHRHVILVECTTDKPLDKLTAISARSVELSARLGKEVDVIPIVFLQCEPLPPEVTQAEESHIALIGKSRIENLISLLDRHWIRVDELIKMLSDSRYPNLFRTF
ncbi:MAG TPA: hypothetical protein VGK48_09635 [Terriglobia bacterium]|jgi:hypothetical protein